MTHCRFITYSLLRASCAVLASSILFGCSTAPLQDEIAAKNRYLAMTPEEAGTLSGEEKLEKEAAEREAEGQREFAGLNFGVGISLTIDTGDNDRINKAEIVTNPMTNESLVRVTDEGNSVARVMLESHYFFQPNARVWNVQPGNWGIGPFIALQPGTEEIIEAVALGVMIGFKRPDESGSSWNIGLGAVVDPNVQILGDGFVANEPPPAGETQVRFKEKSQVGILILASFSF